MVADLILCVAIDLWTFIRVAILLRGCDEENLTNKIHVSFHCFTFQLREFYVSLTRCTPQITAV
ncbi:hypothetical protein os4_07270 [Comamonadaceae bacterium OS-4]|nr:hypothetical protein os4_07270 [Comamonadaceae bacterium OS-4]